MQVESARLALLVLCCCGCLIQAIPFWAEREEVNLLDSTEHAVVKKSSLGTLSWARAAPLPEVFEATVQIIDWSPAPSPGTDTSFTFELTYDGTQPGYYLKTTQGGLKLEAWQSSSLFAVDQSPPIIPVLGPGCRVLPSLWVGWWDFMKVCGFISIRVPITKVRT